MFLPSLLGTLHPMLIETYPAVASFRVPKAHSASRLAECNERQDRILLRPDFPSI
jgi:hypothetical protein